MVQAISGALINLIGEVKLVAPDPLSNRSMTVLVIPHHKDLSQQAIHLMQKNYTNFLNQVITLNV